MRKIAFLLMVALLAAGCGGGGGGDDGPPGTITFDAVDFNRSTSYPYIHHEVPATKVGEGRRCYIYVEEGYSVPDPVIRELADDFDDRIYQRVTSHFGSEPNPGVDGYPKIFILLMDIRGEGLASYTAGYFYALNEYKGIENSNEKEILFMDIEEGDPSDMDFKRTMAHEFQHMIHWEQKTNRLGIFDNTWLDEAMSEIAPFFAGYGPDYGRVLTFETGNNRSDSLTLWGDNPDDPLPDYAVAYMWAQYIADRFPANAFRNILGSNQRGIASVEEYLQSLDPTLNFSSVFRDWSIAVFSGTDENLTGNPAWSYRSIDTRPGIRYNLDGYPYPLPGLFTETNRNTELLPPLGPWSIDLRWYTSSSIDSTLIWTAGSSPPPRASFYDNTGATFTFEMVSGVSYPYHDAAILILQNAQDDSSSASGATNPYLSVNATSPASRLSSVSTSEAAVAYKAATGKRLPVCMNDLLNGRTREIQRRMTEERHAH